MSISNIESKEILIRRLYFDLIGLPPSVQEVDDFINDKDEDSYLKLVDRLLDSKSYGYSKCNKRTNYCYWIQ